MRNNFNLQSISTHFGHPCFKIPWNLAIGLQGTMETKLFWRKNDNITTIDLISPHGRWGMLKCHMQEEHSINERTSTCSNRQNYHINTPFNFCRYVVVLCLLWNIIYQLRCNPQYLKRGKVTSIFNFTLSFQVVHFAQTPIFSMSLDLM